MNYNTANENISQVWKDTLALLSTRTSSHNFESWLKDLTLQDLTEETALILAPDEFKAIWVAENYLELIAEALADAIGKKVALTFRPKDKSLPENNIIQLPLWPKADRAAPSGFLRSSLFGIIQRGRRKQYKREELAAWRGTQLRYTGETLDQADLDIWLQALDLIRDNEFGEPIYFTLNGFLRKLGRSCGGQNREWLKRGFVRMTACAVEFSDGRFTYGGSLITDFGWDEFSGDFFLILNPKLAALFKAEAYTRIEWKTRLMLTTDYSRWLHGYICSHKAQPGKPHRIRLEMLETLTDSKFSRFRDFRKKICDSLEELEQHGVIAEWSINSKDVLTVTRP